MNGCGGGDNRPPFPRPTRPAAAPSGTLDVFAATRLPCFVTGFSYYTRVSIAMATPPALSLAIVLVGYAVAWRHRKTRTRQNMADFLRAKKRGQHKWHATVSDGQATLLVAVLKYALMST